MIPEEEIHRLTRKVAQLAALVGVPADTTGPGSRITFQLPVQADGSPGARFDLELVIEAALARFE